MPRHPIFSALAVSLFLAAGALAQDSFKPGQAQPKSPSRQTPATPTKDSLKDEGHELFGPGKATPDKPGAAGPSYWSIVIIAYHSDTQDADAGAALRKVQTEGGLADAYLEKRGKSSVVAYGRYDDPSSKKAKADLDRVKNIEVILDGRKQKPFAQSFLAPPADSTGSLPEYDLHGVRAANGDWALYTLQIGAYGRSDSKTPTPSERAEFHKAAEQAVIQLRREGEPAYYCHGPNLSMVTIGLFGKDDFDPQSPGVESPSLHLLRQRYPYSLLNGMGVKQIMPPSLDPKTGKQVRKEKIEPSRLVAIPKD